MTVLFIHGAGANPSVWRLQTVHFKDSTAVELPGHPNGSGQASIENYAQIVEQEIDEKRISNPVLVGHSMGGAIAIEIALRKRELGALVLVGTGARLRVHPDLLRILKENYEKAAKLFASWSTSNSCDPVIKERMVGDLMKVNPEVTLGDLMACDKFDRMDRLAEIACRSLILCGEEDRMTPAKYSQYLHEKIKGSELIIIPGAGHSVMLEKHREFNRALDGFLASL